MENPLDFLEAIHSREPVDGLTHNFYRYPARFSPGFARAVIQNFTSHGDVIFDPFMGGGTTLVEARALGRNGLGTDISSLAVFIARAKTAPLSPSDASTILEWSLTLDRGLNLRNACQTSNDSSRVYYQRNINGRLTWPIRKTVELALEEVKMLPKSHQRRFTRCVLLRTAQWALDCRMDVPTADAMRAQFLVFLEQMLAGARQLVAATHETKRKFQLGDISTRCLHRSAIGIENDPTVQRNVSPGLVLTSPPYPGVHVLYHRWQVLGRRETPAPFWISGGKDGHGASFYTLGDRQQEGLAKYYKQIEAAFQSVARICSRKTFIVQMLAFSEPTWQLPEYLKVMKRAGFTEAKFKDMGNRNDGRIWREVPNRKRYADQKGSNGASSEVVLCHTLST